jgi:hypothetical protein
MSFVVEFRIISLIMVFKVDWDKGGRDGKVKAQGVDKVKAQGVDKVKAQGVAQGVDGATISAGRTRVVPLDVISEQVFGFIGSEVWQIEE